MTLVKITILSHGLLCILGIIIFMVFCNKGKKSGERFLWQSRRWQVCGAIWLLSEMAFSSGMFTIKRMDGAVLIIGMAVMSALISYLYERSF